jgi:tetratricopeptide (TPR) repeat protein
LRRKMRAVAVVLAVILLAGVGARADIPAASRETLEDVFTAVRDGLWQENDRFWHAGDFERCIAAVRLVTELDPHDTEAFSNGSWLMWNQGRSDEAEAFLIRGLALNRDVDDLYFDLGFFYYNAGRFSEAIDCLEPAAAMKTHWRTWHMLAHAYEHAGDKSAALNIWLMMEARDPDFLVPRIQIDRILTGGAPPRVRASDRGTKAPQSD